MWIIMFDDRKGLEAMKEIIEMYELSVNNHVLSAQTTDIIVADMFGWDGKGSCHICRLGDTYRKNTNLAMFIMGLQNGGDEKAKLAWHLRPVFIPDEATDYHVNVNTRDKSNEEDDFAETLIYVVDGKLNYT